MSSKVLIRRKDGSNEGMAEIVQTVSYEGDGWYRVQVVFENDAIKRIVHRRHNIEDVLTKEDVDWVNNMRGRINMDVRNDEI